jgi:acetyltransferase-like isoleucine patch superfamily enzyme
MSVLRVGLFVNPWIKQVMALNKDKRAPVIHPDSEIVAQEGRLELGAAVQVRKHACIDCSGGGVVKIGAGTVIFPYAMILTYGGNIVIGENCTVNPFTVLYGLGGLTIGNFVRIATHCVVVPANHVFDDPGAPITKQGLIKKGVTIDDDVWIGAGARILDGIKIGKGSVIAAGAVVNTDVRPYTIVGGVPAREIGLRGGGPPPEHAA